MLHVRPQSEGNVVFCANGDIVDVSRHLEATDVQVTQLQNNGRRETFPKENGKG